jgi:iduronate 2-sulfatase
MFKFVLVLVLIVFGNIDGSEVKPNVLLIMLDDFRGGIGALGDDLAKTPNMDLLVKRSFYFSHAYANQALCAPSRNSMLTSRRPDTLMTYNFQHYWRTFAGNYTTLPQYFKDNGYRTESIGKIFHHGPSSNRTDDYPYSWSNPTFIPSSQDYRNKPVCVSDDGDQRRNLLCPVIVDLQPESTLPDIQSAEKAREFLNETHVEPFFLGVGFYKPHIPFKFPVEYLDRHDINNFRTDFIRPIDIPEVSWNPYNDLRERDDFKILNVSFPYGPVPSEYAARLRQNYYACVSYIDDLLGGILELVNFSNTIVVLTSDHSWSLGEHGEWSKYSNYEVVLKVPLIIYHPEMPQLNTKKIDTITELIDLFPTISSLAGLPEVRKCQISFDYNEESSTCTEGKNLHPQMITSKSSSSDEAAFSQYPRPGPSPSKTPDSDQPKLREIKVMGYSIRTNEFRYTAWIKFNNKKFKRSKFRKDLRLMIV